MLLWMYTALLTFNAIAEVLYWAEFRRRHDFITVDYLIYTREAVGNVQQSYPLPAILAGLVVATTVLVILGSRWLARDGVTKRPPRLLSAAMALVLPPFMISTANVDQMLGSGNTTADELSGNGFFTISAAMRRNELDYDRFYATIPQERADSILAELGVQRAPLGNSAGWVHSTAESSEALPRHVLRRPKNVVLISVESLSAKFVGTYGSMDGLTPRFDELAAASLVFDRTFATGTRTVRGLEALSLGTPPVPGQAIVRRPHAEHLQTLGAMLRRADYSTSFIYGGYGYFDNMKAYFEANDYSVLDRTDFPPKSIPSETVWGVADESLFANTLVQIDADAATGKPFFAHVMTTSNHRPYTYPDGRIDIPSPGGRRGAVKYTDWAIGHFIDEAKTRPWFSETLFVIIADHCASVAGRTTLPVDGYRIPLIFYAPGMIEPAHETQPFSQIDVPPTILDMLGVPGEDYFFGRPSDEQAGKPWRAFISNYQSLGYYKNGVLTVLNPGRKVVAYAIDPTTLESTEQPPDPRLTDEAIAYYQTAARSFSQGMLVAPWWRVPSTEALAPTPMESPVPTPAAAP